MTKRDLDIEAFLSANSDMDEELGLHAGKDPEEFSLVMSNPIGFWEKANKQLEEFIVSDETHDLVAGIDPYKEVLIAKYKNREGYDGFKVVKGGEDA